MSESANSPRKVIIEREILHPPEKVWRALTQKHLMEDWLTKNNFNPEEGSQFELAFEWGSVTGKVLKSEPHKMLSYTWVSGELNTVVTWVLEPTASGTFLRMEQAGFANEPTRYYAGAQAGWPRIINALAQTLNQLQEANQQ